MVLFWISKQFRTICENTIQKRTWFWHTVKGAAGNRTQGPTNTQRATKSHGDTNTKLFSNFSLPPPPTGESRSWHWLQPPPKSNFPWPIFDQAFEQRFYIYSCRREQEKKTQRSEVSDRGMSWVEELGAYGRY